MSDVRSAIRSKVFSSTTPVSRVIEFFGENIEVRQPSIGTILDSANSDDRKQQLVDLIIAYCFVPGTEERVFEEGDKDSLLLLPFGEDVARMQKTIAELTMINVSTELGNSESALTDSTS